MFEIAYLNELMERVKARNAGEREFHQTVEEVLHWLRDRGYLVSAHGERRNAPSDLCENLGYMTRTRAYSESSGGGVLISLKPMLTKAGWEYIFPKIKRYSDTRHDLRD